MKKYIVLNLLLVVIVDVYAMKREGEEKNIDALINYAIDNAKDKRLSRKQYQEVLMNPGNAQKVEYEAIKDFIEKKQHARK